MTKIFPFIKLTDFYNDGSSVYLLSLEITGIRRDADDSTWLWCGGTHYRVRETPQEIMAMVNIAYGEDDDDDDDEEEEPWR